MMKTNILIGLLVLSLIFSSVQGAWALTALTWTSDDDLTLMNKDYFFDTVYNTGTIVYAVMGYKDINTGPGSAGTFTVWKYVLSSGTLTSAASVAVSNGGVTCDGEVLVGPVRTDLSVFVACQDVGTANIVVALYAIDAISQTSGSVQTLSATTDDMSDILYTDERIYVIYADDDGATTDGINIMHMTLAYGSVATVDAGSNIIDNTREQMNAVIYKDPSGDADVIYILYDTTTANANAVRRYVHGTGGTGSVTGITNTGAANLELGFLAVGSVNHLYVSTTDKTYEIFIENGLSGGVHTLTEIMPNNSQLIPIQQVTVTGSTVFQYVNDDYGLYLGDEDNIIARNPSTGALGEASLYSFNISIDNVVTGPTRDKMYRLDADTFLGAATQADTTYTFINTNTSIDKVDGEGYQEGVDVDLVQDQTFGDDDVLQLICAVEYHLPYENVLFADGTDTGCILWKTEDVDPNDSPRSLPYLAGSERTFVHADEYTNYQIHVTLVSGDSEDYDAQIVYDGLAVDREHFDAGDNVQLRMLYQQCYTLQYIVVLTSEVQQSSNICADDVIFKEDVITTELGFTFFNAPWAATHKYNSTSFILTTIVRHENTPYNYTVNIVNGTGDVINSTDYNNTATEIDSQTFNATAYADCDDPDNQTPLKVEIFNEDGRMFYSAYFETCGDYLSPLKDLFDIGTGDFEGWGLLMFLPIIFAAIFTRNTAGIGGGILVAFIGVIVTFGLIVVPESAIWFMVFVSVIGILAYKILKD